MRKIAKTLGHDLCRYLAGGAVVLSLLAGRAADASTLEEIRGRGYLACGIGGVTVGQNYRDETGRWIGFYPDYCRAIAAAVSGSPEEVEFTPTEAATWAPALRSRQIDVLIDGRTWTLQRDAGLGLNFAGIYLYDGQGFLARKALGARRLADIGTARVCVAVGTTTEGNLLDYKRTQKARFELVPYQSWDESIGGIFRNRCDVLTSDRMQLVSARLNRAANPEDFVLLPEVISREPLGPVVRDDDPQWFDIVKWINLALIIAEEKGVTQVNVDTMKTSEDPEIRRLLGVEAGMGKVLGLDDQWALRAIKAVGNYGEIYDRNLGKGSGLGLDRGLNELWSRGGLLYAPPLR